MSTWAIANMMFGRCRPVLEAGRISQCEHSQTMQGDLTRRARKVSFSSHTSTNWESLSSFLFWSLQSFQGWEFRGLLPEPDVFSVSSLTGGSIFSFYTYITHTGALSGWVSQFGEVSDLCYTYSNSEEFEVCWVLAVHNLNLQLKSSGPEVFRMCTLNIAPVH